MKVYHGSDINIEVIDLAKCKPNKDFGKGFYVTNIRQQAEEMAVRVAEWGDKAPVVTEFEFDESAFDDEDISTLCFSTYDEAWLDFIIQNRNKSRYDAIHEYDIVEGPVADDAVSVRIDDYLDGLVSKVDFLEELRFKRKTHQICFCTVRSLQTIKRIDAKPDSTFYHIDDYIVAKLITEKGFHEAEATDLYFTSRTYRQLIDEATEYYLKSWEEIYLLLLKELK
ncbi:hypothetical protein FACS189411_15030 [Bacteroidia bacterium]|nr:hypothetical protein FACS189411_15030 [Bacteroidia bacterium]GHV04323.1 hypothetical protein FACS189416_2380 [Bacteroidia bacterium]